ncbi:MAG: fumarylacetoacetate hydrolase family protein [Thermogutta sp.]|nr:fumarylacetoacetate hydrolase family protein [Thermogutta sp.]HOP78641.1 fumarylacetoacetate hydrolase family protein [Thermogutta sp.]HPU06800.1 fumarylacetoacetate hydrolase family protein [Thermogutta sp.]HQF14798.1 fumarylacetoacetate hydrolase family protein [Thermogutta sp.]
MKLVTYKGPLGPRVGILREGKVLDLQQNEPELPTDIIALLRMGERAKPLLERVLQRGTVLETEVKRLAPIPHPQKVICVGLNYSDHARETGATPPPEPVIFNKFPTAIIGPEEPIRLPRESANVDYEAELVVVIGRAGRRIPENEALDYVAGYMCGNDVSARDWQMQKPGGQWLLGKSFDTFAPTGPYLVTRDEISNPHALGVRLILNGQVMQQSNTNQFIFNIPQLIAYVSQVCTLEVGDLLFTGTPGGVGFARKPPVFLRDGDVVEVEIEGIGTLKNVVVADR